MQRTVQEEDQFTGKLKELHSELIKIDAPSKLIAGWKATRKIGLQIREIYGDRYLDEHDQYGKCMRTLYRKKVVLAKQPLRKKWRVRVDELSKKFPLFPHS